MPFAKCKYREKPYLIEPLWKTDILRYGFVEMGHFVFIDSQNGNLISALSGLEIVY